MRHLFHYTFTIFLLVICNYYASFSQVPSVSVEPQSISAGIYHCDDSITMPLQIFNNGDGLLFYSLVEVYDFYDDFEDGLDNWVSSAHWGLESPGYNSGQCVTESPFSNYGDSWNAILTLKDSLMIADADSARLSFMLQYALECNYDYMSVQINVNSTGWQNLQTFNCYNYAWTHYDYDLSALVADGDYISVRFLFTTDGSVTYNGVQIDDFRVQGVSSIIPWLNVSNGNGSVLPGMSETLTLTMYSQALLQGTHQQLVYLVTNDPDHPQVLVPIELILTGYPLLGWTDDTFDFGSLFENAVITDTLFLNNSGCDTLIIDSLYTDGPQFTVLQYPSFIKPGKSEPVILSFKPDSVGDFSNHLIIACNDTTLLPVAPIIQLTGTGLGAPYLEASEDSLNLNLSCGDSLDVQLTLYNTGLNTLYFDMNIYNTDGLILHYMMDGNGDDMTSFGRDAAVFGAAGAANRYGNPGRALYFDGIDDYLAAPPDVYFSGDFTVTAWMNEQVYKNYSRLFDFGNGNSNDNVLGIASRGTTGYFQAEVYEYSTTGGTVYTSQSLPLNQWFFLTEVLQGNTFYIYINGVIWKTGTTSKLPRDIVRNYNYIGRSNWTADLYYQGYIDDFRIYNRALTVQEIQDLYSTELPEWISFSEAGDSLQAGDSVVIDMHVSTQNLVAGLYQTQLILTTNDPLNPVFTIPIDLTVTGSPVLELSNDTLSFPNTMQYTSSYQMLTMNNPGCDTLHLSAAGFTYPVFQFSDLDFPFIIPPMSNRTATIAFMPQDTGYYPCTLTLETDAGTALIFLPAQCTGAPAYTFIPDTVAAIIVDCDAVAESAGTVSNNGLSPLNWYAYDQTGGDTALSFAASGQYATVGSLGPMPAQGTIEMWIWSNQLKNYNNCFTTSGLSNSSSGIRIEEYASGNFLLVMGNDANSVTTYSITPSLSINTWHHVAVSWNRNTNQVWTYFDGNPVVNGSYCNRWATNWSGVHIGVGYNTGRYWNGRLDEIRIWDHIRSLDEIRAYRNVPLFGTEAGLTAYWNFNEGSGTSLLDHSGNNYHGTFSNATWVPSTAMPVGYVSVNPDQGSLQPGESQDLIFHFESEGLNSGMIYNSLLFTSNDPLQLSVEVPNQMEIIGTASVTSDSTELHFGEVMVGGSEVKQVTFINSGCDTLLVNDYYYYFNDKFFFDEFPFYVLPKDSTTIPIRFSPPETGYFWDTVIFYTNAGDYMIFIDGTGIDAPVIDVEPDQPEAWVYCSDSAAVSLQILNTGLADLILQIPGVPEELGSPVEAACHPATTGTCCGMGILHVIFNTIDTTTGAGTEGYRDYSATQHTVVKPGSTYTLSVYTGDNYLENVGAWIDYNNDGSFTLDESVCESYGTSSFHTTQVTIPLNASLNVPLRMRIGSEYYGYSFPNGCSNVTYGQYEDYTVIIDGGLKVASFTDTLSPGDTLLVPIHFSGTDLQAGDYPSAFKIYSNDPVNPVLIVPTVLHVEGDAMAVLSEDFHDFGDVSTYTTSVYSFWLSNTGCDTLKIWDLYSTEGAFSSLQSVTNLKPGDTLAFQIRFSPESVDFYEGSFLFITNIGDLSIHLVGSGTPHPDISLSPEQLYYSVYCGDSTETWFSVFNNSDGVLHYSVYPFDELEEGLLMYYPFYNNTKDFSGNGRHLNTYGPTITEDHNSNPTSAYHFDSENYMDYDNTWDIQNSLFNNEITVAFWVRFPDTSQWQSPVSCILAMGEDYYSYYGITIRADSSQISAEVEIDYYDVAISCPIVFDQWIYFTLTYDGVDLKIYNDGTLVSTVNQPGPMIYGNTTFTIGKWLLNNEDYQYFTGDLDEFRLYNRALQPYEIQALAFDINHTIKYQVTPEIDSIGGWDYHDVMVKVFAEDKDAGVYQDKIILVSDDPFHPYVQMPVQMEVFGDPEIIISGDCLVFDTLTQYTSQTLTFLIENPTCTPLFVSDLFASNGSYYPGFQNVVVAPHSSNLIPVVFAPTEQGNQDGTFYVESDAGSYEVCLQGYCREMPIAVANPNVINQVLSCQEASENILVIENQGLMDLSYNLNASSTSWFGGIDESGVIPPNSSVSFTLMLNRLSVGVGLYNHVITLTSNDPLNPVIQIPVYLLVPNPMVPVDLGPDAGFCTGDSRLLNAGSYSSYLWNDGSTESQLVVTIPGTYYVDVMDFYNCPSSDTIVVTEYLPPIAVAGADTVLCEGSSIILQADIINALPSQPVQVKVGNGTDYTGNTGPNPFGTYFMDHKGQYLYLAQEIHLTGLGAGNITQIGVVLNGIGSPGMNNFHIRIGTTQSSVLNQFIGGLTDVYSTSSYFPVMGENLFTLQQPYYWDGSSNLVVEICFDNSQWISNSSFQYTFKPGTVIGNYCDNCQPGCSFTTGSSYSERPNLLIHGDGDPTQYFWQGPDGFSSSLKNPLLTGLTADNSGMYILTVDNGIGCISTDDTYLNVEPQPVVDAGPDGDILGGESFTFSPQVTGGVPPYTQYWSPGIFVDDSTLLDATASPLFTTTYTLLVTGVNGCTNSDQQTISVTPRFSLSGHVTYTNSLFSALNQVKVLVRDQQNNAVDSTVTDASGNYLFPYLLQGTYQVLFSTDQVPGSINASDALVIGKHVVQIASLSGMNLKAADVNASNTISGSDALLVLHRSVGNIETFPAGDWYFDAGSVTITTSDKVLDATGICFGDVNSSFIPGLKEENLLNAELYGMVTAGSGEPFVFPVSVKERMNAGAATFTLDLPSAYFMLDTVLFPEGDGVYRLTGDRLSIAWTNVRSLNLEAGDLFLKLILRRASLSPPDEADIGLEEGGEIADDRAVPVQPATLLLPKVLPLEKSSQGFYLGQNVPNPFSNQTVIPYILPEPGTARLDIYNMVGALVYSAVNNSQTSGYQQYVLDLSTLPDGIYHYRMVYTGVHSQASQSRILVISK